uniref:F-box domain-containing protein n=1 Tax=Mycena chlorophos TaxID=658473 RepID=A0ABQ0LDQ9_MYCCL|nr:predicted protein [Mycena chlorophos]
MSLDSLPPELLMKLPYFLDSIEDLLTLSSMSRTLYRTCANPPPKVISQLAANSGRVFFRPHPHLLIAATARELADWAVQSHENRVRLEESMHGGITTLLELAIDVVGLTMEDIRRLWRFKFNVLNPLDRQLDLAAGPATESPITVCNDPETTLVSWVIYGELFHHSVELGYTPNDLLVNRPQPLSSITRYKWFAYCLPDFNCFQVLHLTWDDFMQFMEKCYPVPENSDDQEDVNQQLSMNIACMDFLEPRLWERRIELEESAAYKMIDDPHLRQVFIRCSMHLGFRSLELLVPGGPARLAPDLERLATNLKLVLHSEARGSTEWNDVDDLLAARDAELRKIVQDPWWITGFPQLRTDLGFMLWDGWEGDLDEGPLLEAIANREKPGR